MGETIGARIERIAREKGLPAGAKLADELGVTYETLRKWRQGITAPNRTRATHIARVLGVPKDQFMADAPRMGEGAYAGVSESPDYGLSRHMSQSDDDDLVIDQFDTGGKMGDGLVLRDQPGVIRGWRVSPEWVQKNVKQYSAARNLCIVTGFGDSMRPMFNPGDPLLVDRGVSSMDFDGVYFFRVDGEGFVKRLQRVPGQGIIAISENKAYRDWTITRDMSFEVFGRVLKVWRGEEF